MATSFAGSGGFGVTGAGGRVASGNGAVAISADVFGVTYGAVAMSFVASGALGVVANGDGAPGVPANAAGAVLGGGGATCGDVSPDDGGTGRGTALGVATVSPLGGGGAA